MQTGNKIIDMIPTDAQPSWILSYLSDDKFSTRHVVALKSMSNASNDLLSGILNITAKTFNSYTKDVSNIKIDTKEHILLLMSLLKKGSQVFEDKQEFSDWLLSPNVFFDNKQPIEFLNTISGIKFIDSRLTAMEYGDNV